MPRVALLDAADGARLAGRMGPEARRALAHRPAIGDAIGRYNEAVAVHSELPHRLHELVRYRIAQLNGCQRCMAHRADGNAEAGVTEELLAAVATWREERFTEAERVALDFTERFALDHGSIDEGVTDAVRAQLGDAGLVDLVAAVAKYVAIGRLITVLDLDQACELTPQS